MENIIIAESRNDAVKVGREIFNSKPNVYKEVTVNAMLHTIGNYMKNASREEKEEMLYYSIYCYWVYGANVAEIFFYNFDKLTHEERQEYITSKQRFLYIPRLNKMSDAHILNNKWESYEKFKKYYRRDMVLIESEADYDAFEEFVSKNTTFVVKPTDLSLSQGVYKKTIDPAEDKKALFASFLNEAAGLSAKYPGNPSSSVILEQVIPQSESIGKLHPHSVNAIRCTTIRVGDKVHVYFPWIKMGVGGAFVTTAALGSLLAGVDAKTGIIATDGIGEYGQREEYHPDSKIKIKGFQVPRWNEMLEMAEVLSKSLPTIAYTGWDLVLTDEGWSVMEGNFAGEFLWQLLYGKGMKTEFEELIGWKPEKQFWWE